MIHRINIFLVCLFVALNPIFLINSANASTVGGWSLSNPVAKGASTLYNGAKNVLINGKNVAKTSTALITPVATDVAKVLARGGAAYALSVAVEQILGKGVDWVLDPANNRVKYYVDPSVKDPAHPSNPSYLVVQDSGGLNHDYKGKTRQELAEKYCTAKGFDKWALSGEYSFTCTNSKTGKSDFFSTSLVSNPAYDPQAKPEKDEKSIPLDVVANQVISNAESGDTNAQVATTAAVADIVNDSQNDSTKARPIVNQLEANAETKTEEEATGQSKPNTETGAADLSLTFPVFCGWAPVVCEAAQIVISFPQTLTNWWDTSVNALTQAYEYAKTQVQAVRDYFKDEKLEERETEVDLEVPVTPELPNTNYFSWNAYCPFNQKSDQVTIGDQTSSIDSDLTSWCTMASEVRPFVLMAGAIASLMIVSGVSMRGDD